MKRKQEQFRTHKLLFYPGKHIVNVLVLVFVSVCVQKVVCLVFPLPLYWIRTRGGLL